MTSVLLDTNVYTGLMKGDASAYGHIVQADTVYMSVVVLGELYAGFYGGSKPDWNSSILQKFLDKEPVKIIGVTSRTAKIFGKVKSELQRKGKMIPINDIWKFCITILMKEPWRE